MAPLHGCLHQLADQSGRVLREDDTLSVLVMES
jgi:hypothetical protein